VSISVRSHSSCINLYFYRNGTDSCFSCLWNGRHCVGIGVRGKSHGKTKSLTACGLKLLRALAQLLDGGWSAGAEIVDSGADELPRNGFIEHTSTLEFGAVAALLNTTVALLLALIRAASETSLAITSHAGAIVQSNGLELAAAHAAVVAEVVSEPARALASVDIASGSSIGVVTDQIASLHLVIIARWVWRIRD